MTVMTETVPFVETTPLLDDPDALRAHAAEHGYLFFRNLLNPARLLEVRRSVLDVCARHGWLDPTAPPMAGIVRRSLYIIESNRLDWMIPYRDVQRLRDFNAQGLDPALLRVMGLLFDQAVLAHPLRICRMIFPRSEAHTTPPHQDFWYIEGSPNTWTAWFPCGDCPEELGGLAILPGSHQWGVLNRHAALGAGGHAAEVPGNAVWADGDLACGDVLMFHSLTLHQGKNNRSGNRLRLSCDFRYQPLSEPVARHSLLPHLSTLEPRVDWEDIYAGWPADDPLRYYWRQQNPTVAE